METKFKVNQTIWLSNSINVLGKLITARIVEIRIIQTSSSTKTEYVLLPGNGGNQFRAEEHFIHASAKKALIAIADCNDIDHEMKYKVL